MKLSGQPYQRFSRLTALVTLLAFLIPAGLQAKQLADFCMMEMSHHDTMEMSDNHGCCMEDAPQHHNHSDSHDHNCDEMQFCACDLNPTLHKTKEWTRVSNDYSAYLSESDNQKIFNRIDKYQSDKPDTFLNVHSPPLWLMYDTLLL
ncbi:hypothetical protein [Rhodohalobacter halophilus]|uniref:hypothetical protein n=1 Tax=Rhodohalobacter halophilus TaxID=1812810 RepID=UPI00114CAF17|nr:hypothetical protein [Rhodohalobacter halophilus]